MSEHDAGSQLGEDRYFEMSAEAFCSDELRTSNFKEKDEGRERQSDSGRSSPPWPLYDASIQIQRPHLLDWRIAGSVCKRLRTLGKEAFFIAMDFNIAERLQESSLTRLSSDDQQAASKYLTSVILIERIPQSPSCFITLPRCVAGFPWSKNLDFFFGGREGEPAAWIVKAAKARMKSRSRFIDSLAIIGVPLEKLTTGILISPD